MKLSIGCAPVCHKTTWHTHAYCWALDSQLYLGFDPCNRLCVFVELFPSTRNLPFCNCTAEYKPTRSTCLVQGTAIALVLLDLSYQRMLSQKITMLVVCRRKDSSRKQWGQVHSSASLPGVPYSNPNPSAQPLCQAMACGADDCCRSACCWTRCPPSGESSCYCDLVSVLMPRT